MKKTGYYPLFLNVRGKKCVVVGGGEVALRKVKALLEYDASVEVISPILCPDLTELVETGKITAHIRLYQNQDLIGALIVIAATDDARINQRISEDAKRQGILINVVDKPQYSNFLVPSSLTRGDVIIAVSTSGKSPALARKIRTELENQLGDEYTRLARVVSKVRNQLRLEGITVPNEAWQESLDLNLLTKLLRQHKDREAKDNLLKNLRKHGESNRQNENK